MHVAQNLNFNKTMNLLLRSYDIDYEFVPAACGETTKDNRWHINLPAISEARWRQKNFRLVIHAQDFIHFHGNLCTELFWLEEQFNPDQQKKIIFVHWDHSLGSVYVGPIQCVEFASHSYELVLGLKETWKQWKEVHNNTGQYNFMCLNGRPREYRNQLFQIIKDEPTGFVTHGLARPLNLHPYTDYNFDNVENFIKLVPVYQTAKTSLVAESLYQDVGGIITEKTLQAIAAKHPFLCIGHRNIHKEIAERGFRLYNNLFDLSFDDEYNTTRMRSVLDKNLDRLRDNIDLDQYKDTIDTNFEWLMNGYTDSIRDRASQELSVALKKSS
jgi:hypothetical protein